MTDFASIGIELDSRPVVEGTKALDALAETSAKVEQKVTSMNAGMNSTAQIMRANAEAAKTADDASAKFIAKLQREIELFGANRAEMERYNAAAAGMSIETQRAAAALGAKIDALHREEKAARDAAAAEDQTTKAAERFIKTLSDQVATLDMNRTQLLAYRAAQLGVSDAAAPMIKKLEESGTGANSAGKHLEGLSFQSVGARRELLVLAHELSQGNFQKFGGSMMVLGEQTGAAGLLFSAAGIAALGLTAAVVGVGYALIKGASDQRAMNNALIETGGYAGVTADQLNSMAHAAVEAGGSIREAKKVVAELAGTGKFTGEQIGYITEAAIAMEHATGKSVEKTIKEFESLAVQTSGNTLRSTEAISRAALKLDDTYHFLTESVYEQIRALEKEGEQKAASALATKTLAEVTDKRAEEMVKSLGYVSRAWHGITEFIGKAVDKAGEWGMKVTPAMEVARLTKEIQQLQDGSYASLHGGRDTYNEKTLAAMLAADKVALTKAQAELNKANEAAAAAGARQLAQSEANHAASRIAQDDARLQKKSMSEAQIAIDEYLADVAKVKAVNPGSALVTDDAVEAHITAIKKAHTVAAKGNDDRSQVLQDALTREQTALDREKSIYDARGRMLDLYHSKFGMADADFYAGREAARAEYLASEAITFAKESALVKMAEAQARNPQEVAAAKGKYDQLVKAHEKFVDEMRNASGDDRASSDASSQKKYDDIVSATHNAGVAAIKSLDDQISKQKEHNAEIGKTKEQIELAREAQVNLATVQLQSDADFLRDGLAKWDLDEKSAAVYKIRLGDLDAEIAKRRELAGLHATGADQEALAKASADLDKYLDPTKAEKFGHALRGSFDGAAKSMDDLVTAMQKFGAHQAANDKARAEAQLLLKGTDAERAKGLADLDKINSKSTQEQLAGYGNMTAAAAGFFDEHSRGYKALQTASQVMYAAQLAMNLASIAPAMAAGAAQMFAQSGWGGFAGVAAMAAVVAGFGVALSGGGNVNIAADRQKTQGTGSVFGDSDAKSESIKRALDAVEKNTYQGLAINSSMLATLRSIDINISGFARQVVGNTDIANPNVGVLNSNNGLGTNIVSGGLAAVGGMAAAGLTAFTSMAAIAGPLGMAAAFLVTKIPFIANIVGKIGTAIFGGKQSVEDSGFTIGKDNLASILASGANGMSYADIKTSGGWFSKDKTNTQSSPLDVQANQQFTLILKSMADGITQAAGMLGAAGSEFDLKLSSFVVDIGKISLKGLTGEEQQKALESVFSKLGDDMAQYAIGGLAPLQQVGEGYLETLTRIASEYQAVEVVFQSFGKTFGEVGLGSVAARDRLVQLAGGLDKFSSQGEYFLTNFFSEQEQAAALKARIDPTLAQYGLKSSGEDADKMFRNFIAGLDTTTEEGAKAYTTLMTIAPALRQVVDAQKQSLQDVLDQRKDLQDQLDELTMSSTQLLAKQREALDESNRALFDQVQAVKAQAAAVQAVKDQATTMLGGVSDAYSALQKVVGREKSVLQTSVDAHTAAFGKLQSLSQALHSTLDSLKSPDQKAFERAAAQAQIRAALAISKAGGPLPDADKLKDALSAVTQDASSQFGSYADYMRDLLQTQNDVAQLAGLTDDSLSVEQKSLDALNAQLKSLDAIVSNGQAQLDALNGQSVATLSLAQAMSAFQSSIGAAQTNPVVSGTSTIAGFYQDLLGRAPDQAGMKYWLDQVANGSSLDNIRIALTQSEEYKKLHPFAVGTNFVPDTMPALVHQGERIIPAADNRVLMSVLQRASGGDGGGTAVAEELKALREEVKGLRAEARAIAGHTEKTSRITRALRGDELKINTEVDA